MYVYIDIDRDTKGVERFLYHQEAMFGDYTNDFGRGDETERARRDLAARLASRGASQAFAERIATYGSDVPDLPPLRRTRTTDTRALEPEVGHEEDLYFDPPVSHLEMMKTNVTSTLRRTQNRAEKQRAGRLPIGGFFRRNGGLPCRGQQIPFLSPPFPPPLRRQFLPRR